TIDLGETHSLRGITYLPRQDRPVPDSMIEEGRVESSMDGQSWKSAGTFTFGNLVNDPSLRSYHFSAPVESRFLRIVSLKGAAGKPYAGAAEIGALGK
nr:discoidin domain-containing protein [Akkermansiaceae bacterium]